MSCLPTQTRDELEFVHALVDRSIDLAECRGPLLRIAFWPYRVFVLEHLMDSPAASDVLWDGFMSDGCVGVHFELCAAHWMDLVAICQLRAAQYRRSDWGGEADRLLRDICTTARWDPKEILNMMAWQRERLT